MTDDLVYQTSAANFFVAGQEFTITDFMVGVGELLVTVRETGNWQLFGNTIKSMVGFAQASGKALAYMTNGGLSIWTEKGGSEKDFYSMVEVQSGVSRQTLEQYVETWEAIQQVPEQYREQMLQQPIKNLKMLGSAMEQGVDPTDKTWSRLVEAPTFHEFASVLHDEGLPSRKTWLQLSIDSVSGDIYALTNEGQVFVGWLDVVSQKDNPTLQKSIKRITRSSGMKIKGE